MRRLLARLARRIDDARSRTSVRARLAEDRQVALLDSWWDTDWLANLEGWWAL